MDIRLLSECDRVLTSCGRPKMPQGTAWVDIPYKISFQQFLQGQTLAPASSPVSTVERIVDTEVPFICYGILGYGQPNTPGSLYWRLRLPTGRFLHSKETAFTEGGAGFGSYEYYFDAPVECPPGSKFYITIDSLVNNANVATGLSLVFDGALRYPIAGQAAGVPTQNAELCAMLARYTQNPNQNILAPEWRLGNQAYPETPAGYKDSQFWYVTPSANLVAVPWTGQIVPNVQFPIEATSDFCGRFLSFQEVAHTGTAAGTLAVRIRTDTGYELTDGFTIASAISTVLFPSLRLNAGGSLFIDYMIVDGSGGAGEVVNIQTVLGGAKRRGGLS